MTNKPTVQAYLHTGTEDAGQRASMDLTRRLADLRQGR